MRAKRDKSLVVGVTVIVGMLGFGLAPAAFAEPLSPNAGVNGPPADGTPWCFTYDQELSLLEAEYASGKSFAVLGGPGGSVTESTDGQPGPESLAAHQKVVKQIRSLKAAAIARGDSCIGHFHPGTNMTAVAP